MYYSHPWTRSRFAVLAPTGLRVPGKFRSAEFNNHRHSRLLAAMQRLRGQVYLEDGAIGAEDLTADSRHRMDSDARCWHVLAIDAEERVTACLRYLDEGNVRDFRSLWVSHAALAHCPQLGWKLRMAVESGRERARAQHLGFGSVGGWAVANERRGTMEPVSVILATYGLLQLLGGCVGVATATFRHQSAAILRKIGLGPLSWSGEPLPSYFDPQYGCEMEILQFDSRHPNPKYSGVVAGFSEALARAPVIYREDARMTGAKVGGELMTAVA